MKLEWDFSELTDFADNLVKTSTFSKAMEEVAKKLAKYLRDLIRDETPVGQTGRLKAGWEQGEVGLLVTRESHGFLVEFTNKVEYASYVNYGHESHNQFGGPYLVRRRIKVPTAYPQQNPKSPYWVYGWFFVEQSIITAEDSPELMKLLMKSLTEWWEGCARGR